MQLGSPNLTQKYSTTSPRNPYTLGSKVFEGQGHKAQNSADVDFDALVSACFFYLMKLWKSLNTEPINEYRHFLPFSYTQGNATE